MIGDPEEPAETRVLVVEDNPDQAYVITQVIKLKLGAETEVVEDCASATALIPFGEFDAIVADYRLPDGTGLDLLRELSGFPDHPPVIIMTGYGDESVAVEAFRLGASGYVIKGVDLMVHLREALVNALAKSALERTKTELWESRARLAAVAENAAVGIALFDRDRNILEINPFAVQILGYPQDELLELGIAGVTHPDDWPRDSELFSELVAGTHDKYTVEKRYITHGGAVIWGHLTVTAVRDEAGEFFMAIGMLEDITHRKEMEEELRDRERLMRLITDNMQAVVCFMDREGAFRYISPNLESILGYKVEQLLGGMVASFTDLVHEDDRPAVEAAITLGFDRWPSGGLVYRLRRADGSFLWVETTGKPVHDERGDLIGGVLATADVTPRHEAEEALHESQEMVEKAFRSSPNSIVIATITDGRILDFNDEFVKFTGYSREEMLGRTSQELGLWTAEQRARVREAFERDGTLRDFEVVIRNKRGQERTGLIAVEPIEVNGKPHLLTSSVDITGRKRIEAELKNSREQLRALTARLQAAREEERTQVARMIHDELGQALTGMKIDLSWIEKHLPEGDTGLAERLDEMHSLVDENIGLVRQLAMELRPGILDDLGLVAAIEWQADEFQGRTGVECSVDSDITEDFLDPEVSVGIFRILQEALTNVVRHAGAKKTKVALREHDGDLFLVVEDDGRGITDAEIRKGTSLGILGMRERAHILGGELWIDAPEGRGTRVTLSVPIR